MTIQEIKALPRTEEGIFDLAAVQQSAGLGNIYQAADLVYPVYAAYETTENKKEGYPDILPFYSRWSHMPHMLDIPDPQPDRCSCVPHLPAPFLSQRCLPPYGEVP